MLCILVSYICLIYLMMMIQTRVQVPVVNGIKSREFNWSSMCDALPAAKGKEMKRAYWSCISYVDHLIGSIVDETKALGLYQDTTVVFWSDHGYKLGALVAVLLPPPRRGHSMDSEREQVSV